MLKWLPNRGVKTAHYLPPPEQMPEGDPYVLGFNFAGTASLGTNDQSETIGRAMLLTKLIGFTTAAAGSFLVQIYHQHQGEQIQLFPQPIHMDLAGGKNGVPYILKNPRYVDAGDTITVAISNMGKAGAAYAAADIHVAIWGVQMAQGH